MKPSLISAKPLSPRRQETEVKLENSTGNPLRGTLLIREAREVAPANRTGARRALGFKDVPEEVQNLKRGREEGGDNEGDDRGEKIRKVEDGSVWQRVTNRLEQEPLEEKGQLFRTEKKSCESQCEPQVIFNPEDICFDVWGKIVGFLSNYEDIISLACACKFYFKYLRFRNLSFDLPFDQIVKMLNSYIFRYDIMQAEAFWKKMKYVFTGIPVINFQDYKERVLDIIDSKGVLEGPNQLRLDPICFSSDEIKKNDIKERCLAQQTRYYLSWSSSTEAKVLAPYFNGEKVGSELLYKAVSILFSRIEEIDIYDDKEDSLRLWLKCFINNFEKINNTILDLNFSDDSLNLKKRFFGIICLGIHKSILDKEYKCCIEFDGWLKLLNGSFNEISKPMRYEVVNYLIHNFNDFFKMNINEDIRKKLIGSLDEKLRSFKLAVIHKIVNNFLSCNKLTLDSEFVSRLKAIAKLGLRVGNIDGDKYAQYVEFENQARDAALAFAENKGLFQ